MGWLYVPGLEDSSSDCTWPSGTAIAVVSTSSGMLTQQPPSWRGWRTRRWIELLSGTISRPSMADRGVASWISSLRASHANPGAQLGDVRERMTTAGSGPTSPVSFAKLSPDGSSWRTHPDLFG